MESLLSGFVELCLKGIGSTLAEHKEVIFAGKRVALGQLSSTAK